MDHLIVALFSLTDVYSVSQHFSRKSSLKLTLKCFWRLLPLFFAYSIRFLLDPTRDIPAYHLVSSSV